MKILIKFYIFVSINIFFYQISFLNFTAVLEETIRGVFINRYCTITNLAPVMIIENFSSRILCLQMKI